MLFFLSMPKHKTLLVFAIVCAAISISFKSFAQDSLYKKKSWLPIPILYYKPETRFAFGIAAAYNFYFNRKDIESPPSQILSRLVYTQNKQVQFSLPFNLYWNKRLHSLSGELSFNNFSYDFYGVGPGNTRGYSEKFNVRFPLFRINYLRKISPHVFVGGRWWYEDYRVYRHEESPWLTSGEFVGGKGNRTSGPGLVALYDSRDNIYFSRKGTYLELVAHDQAKHWGSDFNYQRYRFDGRYFFEMLKGWTLGNMVFGDFVTGQTPFSQLPNIGSDKRMRGFYPGRYRDNNLLLYQGEIRGYFYKKLGATAFWNYSVLSQNIDKFSFSNDHASVGLGLRYAFDKEKNMNLRFDISVPVGSGFYKNQYSGSPFIFYFGVNEAF